jgi:hypothetical protein
MPNHPLEPTALSAPRLIGDVHRTYPDAANERETD